MRRKNYLLIEIISRISDKLPSKLAFTRANFPGALCDCLRYFFIMVSRLELGKLFDFLVFAIFN